MSKILDRFLLKLTIGLLRLMMDRFRFHGADYCGAVQILDILRKKLYRMELKSGGR